ncbi:MATE family efflux transporter [Candidatus Poribacteria bacterium]|nr:MATE family efflux transporter [Candidatus Poribacteria bacterium]MYK22027.1 MATE family efflux transporter [Candidatus Poribacteria bacterium]
MDTPENINKEIYRLALPNIVSNFSIPLLGAVDTALMGRLESEYYLGAVGIGGIIFSFIYWGFGFLRMATTGLTAQAFGEKDLSECGRLLLRAVCIGITSSLFLFICQWQLIDLSFLLINASPEVEHHARAYFHIRLYAAPATLCLHAFHGVFLGLQNARYPMLLTIVVNLVNIALNLVFVRLFGMKVEGVALATVIAQYVGLFLAILFFSRYYRGILPAWDFREIFALSRLKRFLNISGDIFIRTCLLVFSHAVFTAKSAALSDAVLAINTILLQFINLMSYAIDGLAFAAESLIGKYKGARDMSNLKGTTRHIFFWSFLFGGLIMLIFLLFGARLLHLFTDQMPLIAQAKPYLIWIIVAPIVNVAAYIWDGIFLGATASKALRNSVMLSTLLFLGAVYLLMPFGNHGLWGALTVLLVARGVSLTVLAPKYLFRQDTSGS